MVFVREGAVKSDSYVDWLMRVCKYFIMPYKFQFLLNISVLQMEGAAYLSYLWIIPDVADIVEWSRHKEYFPTHRRMVSV